MTPSGARYFELIWDFFGSDAAETAAHFHRHLLQRFQEQPALAKGLVEDKVVEVRPGHAVVVCLLPEAEARAVSTALRPRRGGPIEAEELRERRARATERDARSSS